MTSYALRRLGPADADQAAAIHRAAFDERLPWLIGLHTPDEDRAFYRDRIMPVCAVWGAEAGGELLGIVAFRDGIIEQLYVRPSAQGCGIGTALLAKARQGASTLSLWTFQRNDSARRFYERHGFVAVEATGGAGNEEHEPDVRYIWRSKALASL